MITPAECANEEHQRSASAWHEAAHLVTALRLEVGCNWVTIKRSEGVGGSISIRPAPATRRVAVLFAGMFGQRMFCELCADPRDGLDDYEIALKHKGDNLLAIAAARRIVAENRAHVELFAVLLLERETLSEKDIDAVLSAHPLPTRANEHDAHIKHGGVLGRPKTP